MLHTKRNRLQSVVLTVLVLLCSLYGAYVGLNYGRNFVKMQVVFRESQAPQRSDQLNDPVWEKWQLETDRMREDAESQTKAFVAIFSVYGMCFGFFFYGLLWVAATLWKMVLGMATNFKQGYREGKKTIKPP